MSTLTNTFRIRHEELEHWTEQLRLAARTAHADTRAERAQVRDELVEYARRVIDPHTRLDEQVLYPKVADKLGSSLTTSSMRYDHLAIRRWIDELAAADAGDADHLQELLYGLDALIRVHLWKENELYLRWLESSAWPAG